MKNVNGCRACAWTLCVWFCSGISQTAGAADLPPWGLTAPPAALAYGAGVFDPWFDPRCRIVPQPEANLYGDTARFRPTAVCQSRGLYVDSVVVP